MTTRKLVSRSTCPNRSLFTALLSKRELAEALLRLPVRQHITHVA